MKGGKAARTGKEHWENEMRLHVGIEKKTTRGTKEEERSQKRREEEKSRGGTRRARPRQSPLIRGKRGKKFSPGRGLNWFKGEIIRAHRIKLH